MHQKVHTLDTAPLRSESPLQMRSGMALKGFHSFTCHTKCRWWVWFGRVKTFVGWVLKKWPMTNSVWWGGANPWKYVPSHNSATLQGYSSNAETAECHDSVFINQSISQDVFI